MSVFSVLLTLAISTTLCLPSLIVLADPSPYLLHSDASNCIQKKSVGCVAESLQETMENNTIHGEENGACHRCAGKKLKRELDQPTPARRRQPLAAPVQDINKPALKSIQANVSFRNSMPRSPMPEQVTNLSRPQLWRQNESFPLGIIPVRPVRRATEKEFENGYSHELAVAYVGRKVVYGVAGKMDIRQPFVEPLERSDSHIAISAGPKEELNAIVAGWQVNTVMYNDLEPRFFVYWTNDNSKTGCYNDYCGFERSDDETDWFGEALPVASDETNPNHLHLRIQKNSNDNTWEVHRDGKLVGHWPMRLFTYMSHFATTVSWGGEVAAVNTWSHHTTTQMGSGRFPRDGGWYVCQIRELQVMYSNTFEAPELSDLYWKASDQHCYDVYIVKKEPHYILFGGPGYNWQSNPSCL